MIILFVLVAIFCIGIWLCSHFYNNAIGVIVCVLSGFYIVIHVLFFSLRGYDYKILATKRQAFVETLDNARKNNNPLELAAIVKDISDFNQELALDKYNYTVFFLHDYIDPRVLDLQPIR